MINDQRIATLLALIDETERNCVKARFFSALAIALSVVNLFFALAM